MRITLFEMIDLLLSVLVWCGITVSFVLGIVVFWRNPKGLTNQVLAVMAGSNCLWASTLFFFEHPLYFSSFIWLKTVYFLVIFLVGSLYFFSFIFPRVDTKPFFLPVLFFVLPSIFFTYTIFFTDFFLIDVVRETWGHRQILGSVYPFFGLWTFILATWMLINFSLSYKRERGLEKVQTRYILFGISIFAVIAITLDVIFPVLLGNSRFIWFSTIGGVFFVGFTVYAVIRHRLMDIRLVVARSAAYALLVLFFGFFYAGGLFVIGIFITKEATTTVNLLTSTSLALVIAFSFQPLRRFLENFTSDIFYKDRYDTDTLLHNLSQIMASTINLDELSGGVLDILCGTIHISKAALFVLNEKGEVDVVYKDKSRHYLYPKTTQLKKFKKKGAMLVFEEMKEGKLKEIMRKSNISVFIPLKTKESVVGYLTLGEKSSGDIYFNQDLRVLEILAPEFAVALQNAESYKKIQEFSKVLEQKVEERTMQLMETQAREMAKAKELLRLKDEFVFIATHDLRMPATAISGFIQLIDKSKPEFDKDTRESFTSIMEASDRLNQLVDDLLEVARGESGTIKIEVKPVDIVKVVEQSIDQIKPMAEEKKLVVESNVDRENVVVLGDEEKLYEVFENLLSNAVKFNKAGGRISIATKGADSELQIEVSDTGCGIPKEKHGKVFGKFFKHRTDETMEIPGTGLGLFVVRMLIEKMKGKISFKSEEGLGTTFTFSLPLAK